MSSLGSNVNVHSSIILSSKANKRQLVTTISPTILNSTSLHCCLNSDGLCIVVWPLQHFDLPFCLSLPLCGSSETDQQHRSKAWHHPLSTIHPLLSIFRLWIVCHAVAQSITPQNHTSHSYDLMRWILYQISYSVSVCVYMYVWVFVMSMPALVCARWRCHQLSLSARLALVTNKHTQSCSAALGWLDLSHCAKSATTHSYTHRHIHRKTHTLYLAHCLGQCLSLDLCVSVCEIEVCVSDWW